MKTARWVVIAIGFALAVPPYIVAMLALTGHQFSADQGGVSGVLAAIAVVYWGVAAIWLGDTRGKS